MKVSNQNLDQQSEQQKANIKQLKPAIRLRAKRYAACIEEIFGVFTKSIYLCDIKQRNLMKTLSLKLDDSVFTETEQVITRIKKSRNRYINEALDFYNKVQKRKLIASKLEKESKLVKEESLKVLHEFEKIEYES